ncbi:metaxin-1-like [Zophobas morio]|uniref:metaxin-1-like n=1 Tax=Zophobas morio TaxID=2755281 RepID=UPI003083DA70
MVSIPELYVWEGDFGLFSCDYDCLSVVSYCLIKAIPIVIYPCRNPLLSPSGKLPFMRHKGSLVGGVEQIMHYLRELGFGGDYSLSYAIETYFLQSITPAMVYYFMYDKQGYNSVSRWLSARLPFPLSLFFPHSLREFHLKTFLYSSSSNLVYPNMFTSEHVCDSHKEGKLSSKKSLLNFQIPLGAAGDIQNITSWESIRNQLIMCLDDLEKFYFEETSRQNSLGDSYFFGTTATSLDAFLYGYFWFIEKHPAFRDTHLFTIIRERQSLLRLVETVHRTFFSTSEVPDKLVLGQSFRSAIPLEAVPGLSLVDQALEYPEDDDTRLSSYDSDSSYGGGSNKERTLSLKEKLRVATCVSVAAVVILYYAIRANVLRMKVSGRYT